VPNALASQGSEVSNVPSTWRDVPDSEDMGINEPFNHVADVMTEIGLKATTPEATLESIVPLLDNVTGLPVVDEDNKVVGVITRKVILVSILSLLCWEAHSNRQQASLEGIC
jgi:predicted transcriptional regulator